MQHITQLLDVLCVPAAVTGLKPAYDDLEPSNSCCGISLPGYDGEEDRPLERPFIVARCGCSKAAAVRFVDIRTLEDLGGAGAAWGHVRISQTGPPAVLRRLRREMQSTSTVRQAETSWQPSTLGFNGMEPRLC